MGTAFLPEFHEGSLTVQANTLPGTSLAKSDEIGRRVEQILLSQPEVVATARRTGRAEFDEHVQGVEAAEIDVGLRETGRPRAELLAELRRGFSTLPGTNVTIGQPISHRIDHMLSGTRANIAVKVFGDDLGTLRRLGERVREAVEPGAGRRGPVARAADGRPVRALRAESLGDRPLRAARRTTSPRPSRRASPARRSAASSIAARRSTWSSSSIRPPARISSASPICRSTRRAAASVPVRLLADVRREQGPNMILRENVQRRIVISVQRRRPRSRQRRRRHSGGGRRGRCRCRPGIASSTAASSRASRARRSACWCSASLAIAGVFMLLVLAFGRARDALIVMVNLPLALIGGVAGVFLVRRRAQRGVDDRLHHAVRHRHAQRHHARVAHPSPDGRRGRHRLPRGRRAWRATSGWCRS